MSKQLYRTTGAGTLCACSFHIKVEVLRTGTGTRLIKVTKGGKVKVSRKCRKGKTYTIKVRATAKKNKNYNSAKRTQKVKIVVK